MTSLPIRAPFFLGLAASGICLFGLVSRPANAGLPIEIERAWQSRQDEIASARVKWTETVLYKKRVLDVLFRDRAKGVQLPPSDVEAQKNYTLRMDGKRVRVDASGMKWDGDKATLVPFSTWHVSGTHAIGPAINNIRYDESKGFGKSGAILDFDNLLATDVLNRWPITWYLRPYAIDNRVLLWHGIGDVQEVDISVDQTTVSGLGGTRVHLGPKPHFLPTSIDGGNFCIDFEISYQASEDRPVPSAWTVTELASDGKVNIVTTCRVTEFNLNVPVSSEIFSPQFPLGTRVAGRDGQRLVVGDNGELKPDPKFSSVQAGPPARAPRRWVLIASFILIGSIVSAMCVRAVYRKRE